MAALMLFDTSNGNYRRIVIVVNKDLVQYLTEQGYIITSVRNV